MKSVVVELFIRAATDKRVMPGTAMIAMPPWIQQLNYIDDAEQEALKK